MPKKILTLLSLILLFTSCPNRLFAQGDTYDDILLFQSFFRDVRISSTLYGEGFYTYDNYDFIDITTAGGQLGYGLTPRIEVGTGVYYITRHPDEFDGESGILDIPVYGRYNFIDRDTKLSGGLFFTVPVGSEDIGEGNLDFGAFIATRHPVSDVVALTGTLGVDFLETAIEDYEASLNYGGGVIFHAAEHLYILGEFKVMSDLDYSAVSGGLDYQLFDGVHIRTNLLLGTDETSPDFGLRGGILINP